MKVVGLTGGVGMGKSACSDLMRNRGIPVIDTDDLAHELTRPGQPALADIQGAFGPNVVGEKGELRRSELARIVFGNAAARQTLEHILHPRIRKAWEARVSTWRAENHAVVVVVIPLLFETDADQQMDATVCVGCSPATQLSRLTPRGWSGEQVQQRIAAQLPIETKLARSNFVIWNEAGLDVHAAQLDRILATLRG